ncbi:hypothetical protein PEC18_18640 [Paucibacter sp. O1-1]|nr:hypothetical protein [Paucibacter sp. O1-1]MDA3827816.1 hypothetical protein [Paucibacter sp. O1-1]
MRTQVAAVLLAVLGPAVAQDGRWQMIGGTASGYYEIDRQSVVDRGGDRFATLRCSFAESTPVTKGSSASYQSDVTRYKVDCAARTMVGLSAVLYAGPFGTGSVVKTFTFKSPDPELVSPGSIAERLLESICSAPVTDGPGK